MGELTGQVALITGAGRGIGRATAQAFAAAGAAVALIARSHDEVASAAAALTQVGAQVLALSADVTDRLRMEQVAQETERALGPITVLVNNAGMTGPVGPVWELDPEEWRRCIEVDLVGPFLVTRAVLPGMLRRRHGRIINLTSVMALGPLPYGTAYNAAKTALVRFTETLAGETREYGISVFVLDPGLVSTRMTQQLTATAAWKRWFPTPPALLASAPRVAATVPAATCVALATGIADALTGRYIRVQDDLTELAQQASAITEAERFTLRLRL